MSMMSRRAMIRAMAAAGATVATVGAARAGTDTDVELMPVAGRNAQSRSATSKPDGLHSLTTGVKPISAQEHAVRVAKLQDLMQRGKIGALLVESGSTLQYFTGIQWWRSERTTAAVIPATGQTIVVTPYFEEPSIRETLKIPGDVHPWKEDESPFDLLAGALRAQGASNGPLAVEATTRFFILDRLNKSLNSTRNVIPGDDLVRACRMFKSTAELALMQAANAVTIAALRYIHSQLKAGMSSTEVTERMVAATGALGGSHEFSLVLLNEASAFPHGSVKPQSVREGSVILIDTGCTVHGYQSDISRSWVFGKPSVRQRELWNTVKRGQEIALATAKLGTPCGQLDQAVRDFYEQQGWSRDYGLPGLSHRTGHGIGLDGHEPPYLVRNDSTPLQAGMCFSDEPGLYIPGQFGIRLEDCWQMTETGPKLFTPLAQSIDNPI